VVGVAVLLVVALLVLVGCLLGAVLALSGVLLPAGRVGAGLLGLVFGGVGLWALWSLWRGRRA
jgi:hypothetical protein